MRSSVLSTRSTNDPRRIAKGFVRSKERLLNLSRELRTVERTGPLTDKEERRLSSLPDGAHIDPKLFYRFARSISWACGPLRCWRCSNDQRWKCLVFYRKLRRKVERSRKLIARIPYTRSELKALPRKSLLLLMQLLSINPFRLSRFRRSDLVKAVRSKQRRISSTVH